MLASKVPTEDSSGVEVTVYAWFLMDEGQEGVREYRREGESTGGREGGREYRREVGRQGERRERERRTG